ncbi:MAG: hypothetical protein EON59_10475 [Alphaproteobacteria bacterium]|nr:MAG: hypothetical protein EON59_10475 [Alphaproteobacteria bacterium]
MSAFASWERPEVPAESSPIVGYEYAIVQAGETEVIYARTPSTSIPVPLMPPGQALDIYVCALDAAGNRSACASTQDRGPIATPFSFAPAPAMTVTTAINTSTVNGWIVNPKSFARNKNVKHFMKVNQANVFRAIAWFLAGSALTKFVYEIKDAVAPPPPCSVLPSAAQQIDCFRPFGTSQTSIIEPLDDLLGQVRSVAANPGKLNEAFKTIAAAEAFQTNVMDVKTQQYMERALGPERNGGASTDRMRVAYGEVAGRTIYQNVHVTGPLARNLWEDVVTANVKTAAKEAAASIAIAKGLGKIRLRLCKDSVAGEAIGQGARNHLVYWAEPNDLTVTYVGMTSDWGRRCKAKRTRKKRQSNDPNEDPVANAKAIAAAVSGKGRPMYTYPLTKLEAREVEEAMIAHYGMEWNPDSRNRGQLLNARHEFNRNDRDNYCRHLWRGQSILRLNGYVKQATANPRFTWPARCTP